MILSSQAFKVTHRAATTAVPSRCETGIVTSVTTAVTASDVAKPIDLGIGSEKTALTCSGLFLFIDGRWSGHAADRRVTQQWSHQHNATLVAVDWFAFACRDRTRFFSQFPESMTAGSDVERSILRSHGVEMNADRQHRAFRQAQLGIVRIQ